KTSSAAVVGRRGPALYTAVGDLGHRRRDGSRLRAMAAHGKPIVYAAQCIVAGLAIAFAAVMIRPEWVNLHRGSPAQANGYATAVAASSPAVVNIYTERRGVRLDPRGLTPY